MNKLVNKLYFYGTLAGKGGQDDDPLLFSAWSVSSDPKTANSEPSYGKKSSQIIIIMIWSDLLWPELTCSDLNWPALTWTDLNWPALTWSDLLWLALTCSDLLWPALTWSVLLWLYFWTRNLNFLEKNFIRNDRAILDFFLVPFLVLRSYCLDPELEFPFGKAL